MLPFEAAAEIALERAVAWDLPAIGLQRIGDLAHLGDEHLPLVRRRDIALEVRMHTEEPWVHLVIRAQRIMTLAVGADASGDEAGDIRHGGALEQPL